MTTTCMCIELRLLVPNVIIVSCVRARFYVVGFELYILSYYCLYVLSPFVTISVKDCFVGLYLCCSTVRVLLWCLLAYTGVQHYAVSYTGVQHYAVSHTGVQHYAVSYIFTFLFQCCDTRYVFSIKRFWFILTPPPPFFVGGLISYVCYLCLFVCSDIQHVLTMSCMAGVLSIKDRSCLLFASTCMVHPRILGSVLLLFFY